MISSEDNLKLNVLISTSIAIRIDVYKLTVVGLKTNKEEQTIKLNPKGDSDKYISEVQKLLVSKVLGTMGGYPSYLKRWSRMGQVSTQNLKDLLKIGNIEAVVAVANSSNLSEDVLDLVWWCSTNTDQQAEIGRFLLTREFVSKTEIGKEIAAYLLEFLPYTEDVEQQIDTANLVLQDGLIDQESVNKLWKQGQRKTSLLVGFIERLIGRLPNTENTPEQNFTHPELINFKNEQSQIFLKTCSTILKKINQEYVLYRTLEALGNFMVHSNINPSSEIENIQSQVAKHINNNSFGNNPKIEARLLLAGVSEKLAVSTISAHGLMGSAIRKKLSHVLEPIQLALKELTSPE